MEPTLSLYAMSAVYIMAGIAHFAAQRIFIKIIPPWVPYPQKVNLAVGVAELALGVMLLFPSTQAISAWLIMILLVAIFPANIYHFLLARKAGRGVMITALRLPLQLPLIYWAWLFT